MKTAPSAARALLTTGQQQTFDSADTFILAAAAIVLASSTTREKLLQGQGQTRPFLLASAITAYHPNMSWTREEMLTLGLLIPETARRSLVENSECFLARIDPDWAWLCIETLVDSKESARHGSLGLTIAATLNENGDPHWQWPPHWTRTSRAFFKQLHADIVARAAVHGSLSSKDAPELAPFLTKTASLELLPDETASYLVAAAAIDPQWALEMADQALKLYPPEDLSDALLLLGQAAAHRGFASLLLERIEQAPFIAEQAHWTLVAAAARVLHGPALIQHVKLLAPRVSDELDSERELIAGLPLLLALTYEDSPSLLTELAHTWRLPPPLLVQRLFHEQMTRRLPDLSQLLHFLLCRPEDEWNTTYSYDFNWWLAAEPDSATRLAACQHVLALQQALPWQIRPGSLADITHWSTLHEVMRYHG